MCPCYNKGMFLALNEILKEKSRFLLITIVIVLVSYLVFFLTALAYGLASSYTRAVEAWQAEGIVLSDTANKNIARSLLYQSDYEAIVGDNAALLGVGAATVDADESDDVSLFGIETDSFLMPELTSGRAIAAENEVVVSSELMAAGVEEGGTLKFSGTETTYAVVGIVENATFQTAPVVYMQLDTWRTAVSEVSGMSGMRDDTTVSAVVIRGEKQDAYNTEPLAYLSINDFIFALPGYQAQVLTFSVMIGFLIGIAAFVLAIFIYILTMQKKSIFGVLKAEGVPSSYIALSVMVQVVLLSVFGLLVGGALAVLTGVLLSTKVPFAINPLFYGGIAGLFLLCAAIGGIASVRSVTKIDPVEAIE